MGVNFEEREGYYLLANLSGDYTDALVYRNDSTEICNRLRGNPTRVIVSMRGITDINRAGLTGLEKLCWKVAKDFGKEIRLAAPTEVVREFLGMVDFTIPVYETVDKAYESFEEDEFPEDEEELFKGTEGSQN